MDDAESRSQTEIAADDNLDYPTPSPLTSTSGSDCSIAALKIVAAADAACVHRDDIMCRLMDHLMPVSSGIEEGQFDDEPPIFEKSSPPSAFKDRLFGLPNPSDHVTLADRVAALNRRIRRERDLYLHLQGLTNRIEEKDENDLGSSDSSRTVNSRVNRYQVESGGARARRRERFNGKSSISVPNHRISSEVPPPEPPVSRRTWRVNAEEGTMRRASFDDCYSSQNEAILTSEEFERADKLMNSHRKMPQLAWLSSRNVATLNGHRNKFSKISEDICDSDLHRRLRNTRKTDNVNPDYSVPSLTSFPGGDCARYVERPKVPVKFGGYRRPLDIVARDRMSDSGSEDSSFSRPIEGESMKGTRDTEENVFRKPVLGNLRPERTRELLSNGRNTNGFGREPENRPESRNGCRSNLSTRNNQSEDETRASGNISKSISRNADFEKRRTHSSREQFDARAESTPRDQFRFTSVKDIARISLKESLTPDQFLGGNESPDPADERDREFPRVPLLDIKSCNPSLSESASSGSRCDTRKSTLDVNALIQALSTASLKHESDSVKHNRDIDETVSPGQWNHEDEEFSGGRSSAVERNELSSEVGEVVRRETSRFKQIYRQAESLVRSEKETVAPNPMNSEKQDNPSRTFVRKGPTRAGFLPPMRPILPRKTKEEYSKEISIQRSKQDIPRETPRLRPVGSKLLSPKKYAASDTVAKKPKTDRTKITISLPRCSEEPRTGPSVPTQKPSSKKSIDTLGPNSVSARRMLPKSNIGPEASAESLKNRADKASNNSENISERERLSSRASGNPTSWRPTPSVVRKTVSDKSSSQSGRRSHLPIRKSGSIATQVADVTSNLTSETEERNNGPQRIVSLEHTSHEVAASCERSSKPDFINGCYSQNLMNPTRECPYPGEIQGQQEIVSMNEYFELHRDDFVPNKRIELSTEILNETLMTRSLSNAGAVANEESMQDDLQTIADLKRNIQETNETWIRNFKNEIDLSPNNFLLRQTQIPRDEVLRLDEHWCDGISRERDDREELQPQTLNRSTDPRKKWSEDSSTCSRIKQTIINVDHAKTPSENHHLQRIERSLVGFEELVGSPTINEEVDDTGAKLGERISMESNSSHEPKFYDIATNSALAEVGVIPSISRKQSPAKLNANDSSFPSRSLDPNHSQANDSNKGMPILNVESSNSHSKAQGSSGVCDAVEGSIASRISQFESCMGDTLRSFQQRLKNRSYGLKPIEDRNNFQREYVFPWLEVTSCSIAFGNGVRSIEKSVDRSKIGVEREEHRKEVEYHDPKIQSRTCSQNHDSNQRDTNPESFSEIGNGDDTVHKARKVFVGESQTARPSQNTVTFPITVKSSSTSKLNSSTDSKWEFATGNGARKSQDRFPFTMSEGASRKTSRFKVSNEANFDENSKTKLTKNAGISVAIPLAPEIDNEIQIRNPDERSQSRVSFEDTLNPGSIADTIHRCESRMKIGDLNYVQYCCCEETRSRVPRVKKLVRKLSAKFWNTKARCCLEYDEPEIKVLYRNQECRYESSVGSSSVASLNDRTRPRRQDRIQRTGVELSRALWNHDVESGDSARRGWEGNDLWVQELDSDVDLGEPAMTAIDDTLDTKTHRDSSSLDDRYSVFLARDRFLEEGHGTSGGRKNRVEKVAKSDRARSTKVRVKLFPTPRELPTAVPEMPKNSITGSSMALNVDEPNLEESCFCLKLCHQFAHALLGHSTKTKRGFRKRRRSTFRNEK